MFVFILQSILLERQAPQDPIYNMGASNQNSHCSVVGLLGLLIQLILGVLSFSVLIIKRHYESPKRVWRIWRLDTFKQAFSQLVAHFINLSISMALTSKQPHSDTCLWYFTTNVFDNTMGVFLCVMMLRKIEKGFIKKKKFRLVSGNYYSVQEEQELGGAKEGEDEVVLASEGIKVNYRAWALQLGIWNLIVIFSKALLFIMEYFLRTLLNKISEILLGWIEAYPRLELIFVIVVVPVIMNGFAFWVQDSFLKKRDLTEEIRQVEEEMRAESELVNEPSMQKESTNEELKQGRGQEAHVSPGEHASGGEDVSPGEGVGGGAQDVSRE